MDHATKSCSTNRSATTGFTGCSSPSSASELADALRRVRRFQEAEELKRHPDEGLRERKRRLTRQRISDVATILFGARGFDNVKVSEVADIVGVSEKTVYNYFPTKESMVLDWADEAVESMARVIRECPPNESLTAAVVRAMKEDMERFDDVPDDIVDVPAQVRRADRLDAGAARGVARDVRPDRRPSPPRRWPRGPRWTRATPSR